MLKNAYDPLLYSQLDFQSCWNTVSCLISASHSYCKHRERPGKTDNSAHSLTFPPSGMGAGNETTGSSCLLLSLKRAHCCRIVAPSLLVCSLWQVDDVALESLVSRCQSIRHLNLSWTGGGGQITEQALCRWRETMLASGSILALFLGLPHLQCSIGLQYAKTGEGKSKYTCLYDNS